MMEEVKAMIAELSEQVASGFKKCDFSSSIRELQASLKDVKEKVHRMEGKIDYLENQSRRNNIVLHGLEEADKETWEVTEHIVRSAVAQIGIELVDADIERAHRVGRNRGGKRPIVCRLSHYKLKILIMRDAKYLRGTGIFIAEDFSEKVRREREYMRGHMMEARRQGCHAVLQFNKLIIDGRPWSVNELQMMDEERNSREMVEIQGEHNPTVEPRSVATVAEGDAQDLKEGQGADNSTQGSRKETPKLNRDSVEVQVMQERASSNLGSCRSTTVGGGAKKKDSVATAQRDRRRGETRRSSSEKSATVASQSRERSAIVNEKSQETERRLRRATVEQRGQYKSYKKA